jgi:hypothetical protein
VIKNAFSILSWVLVGVGVCLVLGVWTLDSTSPDWRWSVFPRPQVILNPSQVFWPSAITWFTPIGMIVGGLMMVAVCQRLSRRDRAEEEKKR